MAESVMWDIGGIDAGFCGQLNLLEAYSVGAKQTGTKQWGPCYLDSAGDPAPIFKAGRGKRSVRRDYLEHQRGAWIWLLEPAWTYFGWMLESAEKPEDICRAFAKLNSRSRSHLIDPFLRSTTEIATVRSIAILLEEREQAGRKYAEADKNGKEKQAEYERALRISSNVGTELKERRESDIAQREERIRLLKIAKSRTKGKLKKYGLLIEKYADAKAKSRGKYIPFLKEKLVKIDADIKLDEEANANLRSTLVRSTPTNRKLTMDEVQRQKANLDLAMAALQEATTTFEEIRTKLLDQEAFLFRSELLNFIKSKKYSIEPRQIARALAGLPFMKCRHSAELLPHKRSDIPTMSDYELFLFVKGLWERRTKKGNLGLIEWFRQGVIGLPKWLGKGEQKRKNPLRSRLTRYWYFLKRAVEQVQALRLGQIPQPYFIAQRFLADSQTASVTTDQISADREQIKD